MKQLKNITPLLRVRLTLWPKPALTPLLSRSAICTAGIRYPRYSILIYLRASEVPSIALSACTAAVIRPDTISSYAVKIGVTKININSDMRYAYRKTLEQVLRDNPDEYAITKLIAPVIKAVQEVVESKLQDFNSAGKAITG